MPVHLENYDTRKLCRRNVEFLNVKAFYTYNVRPTEIWNVNRCE